MTSGSGFRSCKLSLSTSTAALLREILSCAFAPLSALIAASYNQNIKFHLRVSEGMGTTNRIKYANQWNARVVNLVKLLIHFMAAVQRQVDSSVGLLLYGACGLSLLPSRLLLLLLSN
jgi:hypothetical protein